MRAEEMRKAHLLAEHLKNKAWEMAEKAIQQPDKREWYTSLAKHYSALCRQARLHLEINRELHFAD